MRSLVTATCSGDPGYIFSGAVLSVAESAGGAVFGVAADGVLPQPCGWTGALVMESSPGVAPLRWDRATLWW